MKWLILSFSFLAVPVTYANQSCRSVMNPFHWDKNEYRPAEIDDLDNYLIQQISKNRPKKISRTKIGSVPWTGPKRIEFHYIGVQDVESRFSKAELLYHAERGRSPMNVILWSFINLGSELAHKRIASSTKIQEIRRLAEEIEALAGWKDNTSFLQMSAKIQKLYFIQNDLIEDPRLFLTVEALRPLLEDLAKFEEQIISASSLMIRSYYEISLSENELKKVLSDNIDVALEQGVRLWLRNSHMTSTLERIVDLKELADIYNDGTKVPESFFASAKSAASRIQENVKLAVPTATFTKK